MLIQTTPLSRPRSVRGVSMIEILVTLTIVAFGVLGLLGLQARTLSQQKDSADRKAAAEMVEQLAERMRANHLGFTSGEYALDLKNTAATPGSVATCATKTECTLEEVAARDLDQWVIELRRRIPGSAAYLVWDAALPNRLLVSLAWAEPQTKDEGADLLCLSISADIPANYRCYQAMVYP